MSMINYNREEGKGMLKLRFLPVLLALFLFSCASGDAQAENVWRTLGASFDPFSGTITYYTRPAGGGDLYPEMDIFFSLSFSDDGARDYRIYFDYPSEPLVLYSDGNPVVSFSSAIEDTYARSYIQSSICLLQEKRVFFLETGMSLRSPTLRYIPSPLLWRESELMDFPFEA